LLLKSYFPHSSFFVEECYLVIDFLGANFYLGNCFKYIWRLGNKNFFGFGKKYFLKKDLKKAYWYIQKYLEKSRKDNLDVDQWVDRLRVEIYKNIDDVDVVLFVGDIENDVS
jgi:helix-turn-helix protein